MSNKVLFTIEKDQRTAIDPTTNEKICVPSFIKESLRAKNTENESVVFDVTSISRKEDDNNKIHLWGKLRTTAVKRSFLFENTTLMFHWNFSKESMRPMWTKDCTQVSENISWFKFKKFDLTNDIYQILSTVKTLPGKEGKLPIYVPKYEEVIEELKKDSIRIKKWDYGTGELVLEFKVLVVKNGNVSGITYVEYEKVPTAKALKTFGLLCKDLDSNKMRAYKNYLKTKA